MNKLPVILVLSGLSLAVVISGIIYYTRTLTPAKTAAQQQVTRPASVTDSTAGGDTESSESAVSMPTAEDTLRSFFAVLDEGRTDDAMTFLADSMLSDETVKESWKNQLGAFESAKVISMDSLNQGKWSGAANSYKVSVDVTMKSEAASAPIPNYGWANGVNTRWITLTSDGKMWKLQEIATGP